MATIRVNGISLYYEEYGEGAAIVGIHGGGSSAAFWSDAARELAKHGRAIVYDRRGSFRSERPEPYATNVHEQADDAAALIDALEAAPAIVIGRSYGGAVALDLALRYADRLRALVQLEGDGALMLSQAAVRELAQLTDEALAAAAVDSEDVATTVLTAVAGAEIWQELPTEAKRILTENSPALLAELRGGYPAVTVDELASLKLPTLLVGGKNSLLDYSELIELTAAAMPAAKAVWVEGGHLIDPAHPVVLDFVREVLADRR